jgi:hypothetical protein
LFFPGWGQVFFALYAFSMEGAGWLPASEAPLSRLHRSPGPDSRAHAHRPRPRHGDDQRWWPVPGRTSGTGASRPGSSPGSGGTRDPRRDSQLAWAADPSSRSYMRGTGFPREWPVGRTGCRLVSPAHPWAEGLLERPCGRSWRPELRSHSAFLASSSLRLRRPRGRRDAFPCHPHSPGVELLDPGLALLDHPLHPLLGDVPLAAVLPGAELGRLPVGFLAGSGLRTSDSGNLRSSGDPGNFRPISPRSRLTGTSRHSWEKAARVCPVSGEGSRKGGPKF